MRMPKELEHDICSYLADWEHFLSLESHHAVVLGLGCQPEEQCLGGLVQLSSSLGNKHAAPELVAGLSSWTYWDA